jgi:formate dehydrogenase
LKAGDFADVKSRHGSLRIPVQILEELMRGTVAIPHGWGHQHSKGLSVAGQTKGVNVNILAGSGSEEIDPLSGMSKLTALDVKISRAKDSQAHSWSGLPD